MLLMSLAIATMQTPSWSATEMNIRIKSADCVVVARITGPAVWSERQLLTSEDVQRPGETIWVARVPMRTTLTLRGGINAEFAYVESQSRRLEGGGTGATQPMPHSLAEAS